MKVHFNHTPAKNGGYGILGKGIREAFEKHPKIDLIAYCGEGDTETTPDVYFSYGLSDTILERMKWYKWKRMLKVHYLVWESSELPKAYIKALKQCDVILVSAEYLKEALKKQGIECDIFIWDHAVDDRFAYRKPVDDGVFTFLHHNGYEFRKGTDTLIKAFTSEFGVNEPVKLVIKFRERQMSRYYCEKPVYWTRRMLDQKKEGKTDQFYKIEHPLIEEVMGHISDQEMVELNAKADCFVFPAKGEGWGLPPFEAMAMGIVPIIPVHSGFTQWFDDRYMIEVAIDGYINSAPRYPGYMWHISQKDLQKKMRWAYMNQEKLVDMGKQGSEYIHRNFNWVKVTKDWYNIIRMTI